MATRTATLTVSVSTNLATAHLGKFFADLRVNGKQTTRVGNVDYIREFIGNVIDGCTANNVDLTVADETYQKEFTAQGGLIGTPYAD